MRIAAVILILCALCSCEHKRLVYPGEVESGVDVTFEWDMAPEADPEGMTVIFYGVAGQGIYRFDLAGSAGGRVRLPVGVYDVLCYNSDTNGNRIDCADDFHLAYVTTAAKDGSIHQTPSRMWTDAVEAIEVEDCCCCCADTVWRQSIILHPRPVCADYHVHIRNMSGLSGARQITALLDGLTPGRVLYDLAPLPTSTAMQFKIAKRSDSLAEGSFTPFGAAAGPKSLLVEVVMKNDSVVSRRFDVTRQIDSAPDPMNVHIWFDGWQLPAFEGNDSISGGAFDAAVDGWETIDINLRT